MSNCRTLTQHWLGYTQLAQSCGGQGGVHGKSLLPAQCFLLAPAPEDAQARRWPMSISQPPAHLLPSTARLGHLPSLLTGVTRVPRCPQRCEQGCGHLLPTPGALSSRSPHSTKSSPKNPFGDAEGAAASPTMAAPPMGSLFAAH